MKKDVSKELLSEVLKEEIEGFKIEKNVIRYKSDEFSQEQQLNIYEFLVKCELWAFDKGYTNINIDIKMWNLSEGIIYLVISSVGGRIKVRKELEKIPLSHANKKLDIKYKLMVYELILKGEV